VPKELKEQHKRFCRAIAKGKNSTQAAIAAGYSKKTAVKQGSRLLTNADIKAYVKELQDKGAKKFDISQEQILRELYAIAFSDIRKFYDEKGALKPINELDKTSAAALAGLDIDELFEGFGEERTKIGVTKKIKRFDKVKAIEVINKMLGYNAKEKVEHSMDKTFFDFLKETGTIG
jgi:phage terminase small subunit